MDPKMLSIGQSIMIKRSDGMDLVSLYVHIVYVGVCMSGRVHAAAISGIDTDKQYIAVEWFENNETKGKEVSGHYLEVITILSLPLHLVPPGVKNQKHRSIYMLSFPP